MHVFFWGVFMRFVIRTVSTLLLASATFFAYSEDKKVTPNILAEAEKLFEAGDGKKAADLLEKKIRKSDDELSLECRIRLAEYYDSIKKINESSKLVEKYGTFSSLESIKLPYHLCLEAFGESSFAAGASGEIYKGMKALDIARDRTKGLENALISYYTSKLLHYYAKDTEALKHIDEAYQSAKKYLEQVKSQSSDKLNPETEYWNYLKRKLDLLKAEIDFAMFALEYGEDYALYKKGREYQLSGKFRRAAGIYGRLIEECPGSYLQDAARCYRFECQLEDSDLSFSDVEKAALKFVDEKPYGLYRSEILAVLGKYSMETLLNVKLSEKYYSKAYEICGNISKLEDSTVLYSLPEKVGKLAVTNEPMISYKDYFVVRRKIKPEEIINHKTSKSYSDELRKECAFMLGFAKFADGKFQDAEKLFTEAGSFDKELLQIDSKKMPNAIARLRGACQQGFLYLTQDEMKYFKDADRTKMLLADFYFALEYFNKAYALYNGFTSDKFSMQQRCLAYIRRGYCESYLCKPAEAFESFNTALKFAGKDNKLKSHVCYALGCLYSANGKADDAMKYLKMASESEEKGYYSRLAHHRLITDLGFEGKVSIAREEYDKFCKLYSEKPTSGMEKFFEFCESNSRKKE